MWLAATSACWFLLDFAFCGLGIDNPRRIAAIWAPSYPNRTDFQSNIQNRPSDFQIGESTTVYSSASILDWENPFNIGTNMYQQLYRNAFRYVIAISIGSLVGSLVMITLMNKLPRKESLMLSFIILAVLFIIMGASMQALMFQPSYPLAIVLYVLCQFFFNFGRNTLTFIIPAEIFPTKYRCTCHGISAASGKFGSLAVQGLLSRPESGADTTHFRIVLGCFVIPMTLGAVFAWGWQPSLQEAPLPANRTKYATGPRDYYPPADKREGRPRGGGEILSFKGKLREIRRNVRLRLNGGFAGRNEVNGGGAGAAEMLELSEVPMVNGNA